MATATATLAPHRAPPEAVRLVLAARRALADADGSRDPLERYAGAHLAALRAAAAVLAARAQPGGTKPRRPTSAWSLLVVVAPELEPWAAYFAAGARTRAAAEAGLRGSVTTRQADDLVRDVGTFVGLVETMLGMLSLDGLALGAY